MTFVWLVGDYLGRYSASSYLDDFKRNEVAVSGEHETEGYILLMLAEKPVHPSYLNTPSIYAQYIICPSYHISSPV